MFVESLPLNILIWIFVTAVGGTIALVLGNYLLKMLSTAKSVPRKLVLALLLPALYALFFGLDYVLDEAKEQIMFGTTIAVILLGYWYMIWKSD